MTPPPDPCLLLVLAALLAILGPLLATSALAADEGTRSGELPRTRPERTENAETSTIEDVRAFLDVLAERGGPHRVGTLGVSEQGRVIPLVVTADPMVADGAAARASGRIVVYVQANIHGGEVEGKEAVLRLLREISAGEHASWLERCVLVWTPVYNVDGNEAWGEVLRNRRHQNGPERVGLRPNGGGLDLNRDCLKAESPEMRAALAGIYRTWDPHVVLDLHTTNGTRHGYTLTYAPPLHPDTEAGVLTYSRDTLLPEVRTRMRRDHGEETQDYGNVEPREDARGWYTFSPYGRYVTNYVGLRNRIAVLSEATSYLPFGTRITSTHRFVATVLDVVTENAGEVAALCRAADERVAAGDLPPLGLAFEPVSRGEETIPLEHPDEELPPYTAPGRMTEETLPVFDRFRSTETRALPRGGYWIPAAESKLLALLRRHGIEVDPCRTDRPLDVEEFRVTAARRPSRPFQGHRMLSVDGGWSAAELPAERASGGFVVTAAQPLAILAFHLLEPDDRDSAVAWEVLSEDPVEGAIVPIRRLR